MKRLTEKNLNTSQEYDKIFDEKLEPDWQDKRRWKALLRYFNGGNIIDLGCLDSEISKMIEDKPGWYLGIDIAEKAMLKMQTFFGNPRAKFQIGDLYATGFDRGLFDYAVLGEVLEHLERPLNAVQEAFRILKPGGVLAISVPLEEAKEPGACDADRHLWSFSKRDVEDMVKLYSSRITSTKLRSKWFPRYKYAWPSLILWAWKK